ncbi:flavodoxin family protein [Ancylobacter dichloromethanicus]|uniref:NADPH-dependent FMN reductase-like domain-containing protein n=1 Tax=Ancylobacter dichloromethanicus TaxID=518825 RepID=A0A9W6JCJ4_9HYPH|nr:NAD(P)H-dependent oxidoreductase [Ancylobacter dichloromethanicus]GLK74497.1 hypothetical protein GCM10017643_46150 [Ancylobacter dichloromethanicus]
MAEFGKLGAAGELVRVADLDIKPGVNSDESEGDEWPALRRRILAADILLIGTPIWLGQPSSVAKRVLEWMDAFLSEGDERGRMPSFGKVAAVAVVGNEDGAHHCHAELFQALNDVGFRLAPGAGTYWVSEAIGSVDYQDLEQPAEKTRQQTASLAVSTVHIAGRSRFPAIPAWSRADSELKRCGIVLFCLVYLGNHRVIPPRISWIIGTLMPARH